MSIIKEIFTPFNNLAELPDKVDLDSLFKEFYDRLVYFSVQFVKDKDQAQDIVQDSFIKYWNQRERQRPNRSV